MQGRIYLDGNSLGPPSGDQAGRLADFVTSQWDADLIRGWTSQGWWEAPLRIGDRIGRLLGAAAGQVVVGDNTTIMLYKMIGAGLNLRSDRRSIVTHTANFPTDRHVIDSVARATGVGVRAVSSSDLIDAIDESAAVVVATHVDFRSAERFDMAEVTAAAHDAGAVVVWDLSHSVGAMDVHLDACDVDLAVGCTYKYLNGGPGSPAFAYVASRHLPLLDQPLPGWIGHADPFSMAEDHRPAADVRRVLSGTPPVLGLASLDIALDRFDEVDMTELRRASLALTDRFMDLADRRLAGYGFSVITPRDHERRGSHVSLSHPDAYAIVQALVAAGVVGDFREPSLCRFGFAPLYLTVEHVDEAVDRLVTVMETRTYEADEFAVRSTVT